MLSLDAVRLLIETVDFAAGRSVDPERDQAVQIKMVKDLCEPHGLYRMIAKAVCNNNIVTVI